MNAELIIARNRKKGKMNKRMVFSGTILLLLVLLLAPVGISQAAQPAALEQPKPARSADAPIDPAELETFLNPLMQAQMEERHIAGAVVAVVQDGKVLFSQGYGLADVEGNKPVDPETTLFRLGSISKTFTFTAVMQLVEQGKLDLNADINAYLDFKIPDTFPEPITMAHLMSHSAGMDEYYFGTTAPTAESVLPLGEYLRTHLPPRVRPPGIVSGYTNFGAALAGYIVERVSGQPYDNYIEEHILKPLGMDSSTPRMILPASLSQALSLTYVYADGNFSSVEDPFSFNQLAPAGGLKSTAADMARYMIAHLQDGEYQGARILDADTARLMHEQSFTQDPRLRGWAHGFEELRLENPRLIGHSGVTYHYYTQMYLVPEANLGIFVANNTSGGRKMVDLVAEAFIDHYFPSPAAVPPIPLVNSPTDLKALEGSYASANSSFATKEKPSLLLSIQKIQAQEDGSLIRSSLSGSQRYVETEPMLFQRDDGARVDYFDQITFRLGSGGKAQYLLFHMGGFQKLPWYETLEFSLLHASLVLLLFLSVPVAALIWRFSRRLREQAARQPWEARWARWALGSLVALYLLSQAGLFSAFASEAAVLTGTAFGNIAGQYLAYPVVLLALATVVFTYFAWKKGYWSLGWRIHYTLVTLAAVSIVWWYFNWHVIG
jgi:CubicO group peptidase (beta-lactamase class C family)